MRNSVSRTEASVVVEGVYWFQQLLGDAGIEMLFGQDMRHAEETFKCKDDGLKVVIAIHVFRGQ